MKIKQLKHQLIGASLAVVLTFVALSASTYAWFVNNTAVKAEGMNISVQTDGTCFEIAIADGSAVPEPVKVPGQTTASYTNLSASLFPTHPNGSEIKLENTPAWVHAFSYAYDDAEVDADTTELNASVDYSNHLLSADGKDYALVATYFIHLNHDSSAENITIDRVGVTSASFVGGDKDIKKSITLLVVGEDGADVITYGAASGNSVICNQVKATDDDDVWHQIDVYAYFDGMNEFCKSSVYDNSAVDITLVFGEMPNN